MLSLRSVDHFPDDILTYILQYACATPQDLSILRLVNKQFHSATSQPVIWRSLKSWQFFSRRSLPLLRFATSSSLHQTVPQVGLVFEKNFGSLRTQFPLIDDYTLYNMASRHNHSAHCAEDLEKFKYLQRKFVDDSTDENKRQTGMLTKRRLIGNQKPSTPPAFFHSFADLSTRSSPFTSMGELIKVANGLRKLHAVATARKTFNMFLIGLFIWLCLLYPIILITLQHYAANSGTPLSIPTLSIMNLIESGTALVTCVCCAIMLWFDVRQDRNTNGNYNIAKMNTTTSSSAANAAAAAATAGANSGGSLHANHHRGVEPGSEFPQWMLVAIMVIVPLAVMVLFMFLALVSIPLMMVLDFFFQPVVHNNLLPQAIAAAETVATAAVSTAHGSVRCICSYYVRMCETLLFVEFTIVVGVILVAVVHSALKQRKIMH